MSDHAPHLSDAHQDVETGIYRIRRVSGIRYSQQQLEGRQDL